jgi:hypothetical protein
MALHNQEIKNRIRLSVYAYAYEFMNDSLVSDAEFDRLSQEIDLTINTGNEEMDSFFAREFIADSGMWIRKHPNLDRVKELYENFYRGKT